MNNLLVKEVAAYITHQKQETNLHDLSEIRTPDTSNQAASEVSVRPHGRW
jgi:hypothetical protein